MKKFNLPKFMDDENAIYEVGYNKVLIITQIIIILFYCLLVGWLIMFYKTGESFGITLFDLLLFNTPVIMLLIIAFFAELLSYPLLSSYIITNKRIIINKSGFKNTLSNFITSKKSSISFDEITNINPKSGNIILEIQYKNKTTDKSAIFPLFPANSQEFVNILQNQIEIYKNTPNNNIDFKYIKRVVKPSFIKFFLSLILVIFLCLGLLVFNITNATIVTGKIVKFFNPNNSIPYKSIGSAYKEKGNYDLAIKYLKKAVELDPESLISSIRLANCYYKKGLYDKAIEYKEKVLPFIDKADMDEYHEYNNFIILESKKKKRIIIQDCGFSKEDFTKIPIRKIYNPNKFEDDAVNMCSIDYGNLGDFYAKKEEYDKAIIYYKKSIFHNLNNYDSYKKLAAIYKNKGLPALSEKYFLKTKKLEAKFKIKKNIVTQ